MSHITSLTNHSKYRFLSLMLFAMLITGSYAQTSETSKLYTEGQRWGFGIASSVGVSMLGFIMSAVMLLILKWKRLTKHYLKLIITILIAFAVGALLGDAIVHIVPEVFGAHSHEEEATTEDTHAHDEDEHAEDEHDEDDGHAHQHEDEHAEDEDEEHDHEHEEGAEPIAAITSLLILVGFGAFVIIEKLFDWLGIAHSHGFDDGHHGHHHVHDAEHAKDVKKMVRAASDELKALPIAEPDQHHEEPKEGLELQKVGESASKTGETTTKGGEEGINLASIRTQPGEIDLNENKSSSCFKTFFSMKGRKTSGMMILMADFLHNIMDGLALGVAFASGKKDLAVSTFVAILAHEIPQEIGDMGILLDSKFPVMQALCCNGLINFSAIIGTVIGLAVGSINEAANAYVLAFVAGNFLYIALVSMLPMVMKEMHGRPTLGIVLAFIVGAGIQFALLAAEDH